MPLAVHTSRLGSRDPDYLDISLQGNLRRPEAGGHQGIGLFFAPSPGLLYPYLSKRKFGRETDQDWLEYTRGYTAEMRASYRKCRLAWDALLARERVVLLCFCTEAVRCHRTVLARDILPALGAKYLGELPWKT